MNRCCSCQLCPVLQICLTVHVRKYSQPATTYCSKINVIFAPPALCTKAQICCQVTLSDWTASLAVPMPGNQASLCCCACACREPLRN
jgi:hypothetical protein